MSLKKYEVTGYDKQGRRVFHLVIVAANSDVAKLYAIASLERTADGADVVKSAVKTEARLRPAPLKNYSA